MTTPARYLFEGQERTVAEIVEMMTAYSERSIRAYLKSDTPPTTRAEVHEMARRSAVNSAKALRANAAKNKRFFGGAK